MTGGRVDATEGDREVETEEEPVMKGVMAMAGPGVGIAAASFAASAGRESVVSARTGMLAARRNATLAAA